MPFGQQPTAPGAFAQQPAYAPTAPQYAAQPPAQLQQQPAYAPPPGHVQQPPAVYPPPGYLQPPAAAPFQRSAAQPPQARPPVAPGTSRWAGVQSAKDRPPFLGLGHYRLRVLGCEMGFNDETREESFKSSIEVVEAAPGSLSSPGERAALVFKFAGKAAKRNAERAKSYVVAAAGYSGDPEYDAFDPQREFLDSLTGAVNAYSQAGLTITGRLVDVFVRQGGAVKDKVTNQPTGEFYNDYGWQVVPEAEQDQTRKPGT